MSSYRKPTKAQQQALLHMYQRSNSGVSSFLRFRRSAFIAFGDCLMVPWCGMTIGIEKDGYTHS